MGAAARRAVRPRIARQRRRSAPAAARCRRRRPSTRSGAAGTTRPTRTRERRRLTPQQLARQQRRAEARMDQPGELEQGAVRAGEMDRQHRGAGAPRQPDDARTPGRIGDRAVSELEVRHFAGREHGEAAAGFDPPLRRLEPAHAAADGRRRRRNGSTRITVSGSCRGAARGGGVAAAASRAGRTRRGATLEGQAVDAAERMVWRPDAAAPRRRATARRPPRRRRATRAERAPRAAPRENACAVRSPRTGIEIVQRGQRRAAVPGPAAPSPAWRVARPAGGGCEVDDDGAMG